MKVRWQVGPGVRCNLIAYGARNLTGKRQAVQLFPQGAQKGTIDGSEMSSMVLRGVLGTRVILCASTSENWDLAAWRCVRMLEKHSLRSEQKHGLPGIRVPDLELLDTHGAKRTDPDFQSSYPAADSLAEGTGWTFGKVGKLSNRVAMILVDREDVDGVVLSPPERVAVAILEHLVATQPAAVPDALQAACEQLQKELSGPDIAERIERLQKRFA
jgi:hypothetical protein